MGNLKISEMTYKTLDGGDLFPTINPAISLTANYNTAAAEIPVFVGISKWNADTIYQVGHTIIYNSAAVKGMFMVDTLTIAGDAPEGAGFDKFKSIGFNFINTIYNANFASYFIDINGGRTGSIVFNENLAVNDTILIVLTGDWTNVLNKNLIITNFSAPLTLNTVESFNVEYIGTQINIRTKVSSNYNSGFFRIKFELHG